VQLATRTALQLALHGLRTHRDRQKQSCRSRWNSFHPKTCPTQRTPNLYSLRPMSCLSSTPILQPYP